MKYINNLLLTSFILLFPVSSISEELVEEFNPNLPDGISLDIDNSKIIIQLNVVTYEK